MIRVRKAAPMAARLGALSLFAASSLGLMTVAGVTAAPASADHCTQVGYEAGPWGPGKAMSCTDAYGDPADPPQGVCDGRAYQNRFTDPEARRYLDWVQQLGYCP